MTPRDIIEKEIAKKLKEFPEKAKAVNAIIELDVTGDDGGKWSIDCTKGGKISAGSTGKAALTVTVSDSDFVDLFAGKLSPTKAYFSGKLKLKGDMSLAFKLGNII